MSDHPVRIVGADGIAGALHGLVSTRQSRGVTRSPGAVHALQALEGSPAHVLLLSDAVADIPALDFAQRIKEMDRESHHYTFIVLVTTTPWAEPARAQVADRIDLSVAEEELGAALPSALRLALGMSERINRLLKDNVVLQKRCLEFQNTEATDALTGLGNRRYLDQSLVANISQIEARGGAVCLILMGIANHDAVRAEHGEPIAEELVLEVSRKIKRLVRPLDVVTYLGAGLFGLVLNQPMLEDCQPRSYARIYDGTRLKSYRTAAGFLEVTIGMGFCASGAETGPPKLDMLYETASDKLRESYASGEICFETFDPLGITELSAGASS
ncbi:MAG TPA: diguanylate cyclase [Pseudomonadales bacterium]|nr:diguanylate cyclase [Pseudomonadales bacterium]